MAAVSEHQNFADLLEIGVWMLFYIGFKLFWIQLLKV